LNQHAYVHCLLALHFFSELAAEQWRLDAGWRQFDHRHARTVELLAQR
jgi:hypothetical protein